MAPYVDLLSHDADSFVFCSGFRLREVLGWLQSSRLCMCIPTPTYTYLHLPTYILFTLRSFLVIIFFTFVLVGS